MPLSAQLLHKDLTVGCQYCGHTLSKKGTWFYAIHQFKCAGCGREIPLTYSDKVALFKKHAHLLQPKPKSNL